MIIRMQPILRYTFFAMILKDNSELSGLNLALRIVSEIITRR